MGTVLSDQLEQTLPPAYKGPRFSILLALKRAGSLTAKDLAEQLDLSSNAVRHHLRELESEGVIAYRREQRGVGAPTFAWYLTPSGEALFPQRYKEVLTEVLDRVAAQAGRQAVVSALETRFAELTRKLQAALENAPPERRMEAVIRALVDDGYMAEWRSREGGLLLTEHNCAIRALAERFPEICAAEARFLEEVLAAAVHREAHMLQGCTSCEYRVEFPEATPIQLPPTHATRAVREDMT
ncbi:MAG TPA: winged helix-turn-helix transcriptional regulator [Gemmatimonadales bacterium]|nr:winged helix-turn-helix transcriptional regulator [Gemmatimonadales bacterium]